MQPLLARLESHNEYSESAEARQLRKDSAEEIRRQAAEIYRLELALAQARMMRGL